MSPLLLILSDWAYLLLRLTLGGVVFKTGLDKWHKTHLVGVVDLILGGCLFLGLATSWASAFVAVEMISILVGKLWRHRRLHSELPYDLLLVAVCLFILTRGAGDFLSLDAWLLY